jgi:hypothetical protein
LEICYFPQPFIGKQHQNASLSEISPFLLFSVGTTDEWGWCSSKCTSKKIQTGNLLETELTILSPKICESMFFNGTETDEGFDEVANFTNILRSAFLYKSYGSYFYILAFLVCTFLVHED